MNRFLFMVLLSSSVALAQDVDLPVPKPNPTPVPVVTEKPEAPTPTPTPIPTIVLVTPSPVQQAVVPTLAPLPPPPTNIVSVITVTTPPTSSPMPTRLYKVGSFPAVPRIKPAQLRTQGRVGSWLIGKFIVISQEDDHHYTCQSHVDSVGIGIVDIANHIGGGSPVILKLYVVDPPEAGLPREFAYGPASPLKITGIQKNGGLDVTVSAEDLTDR